MGRYPEIQKGHEEDREQQQGQPKKEYLPGVGDKPSLHRHDSHQLPAGIAHRFDRHIPDLALIGLPAVAIAVTGSSPEIFLHLPRVDQLHLRVVDQLSARTHQIKVAVISHGDAV